MKVILIYTSFYFITCICALDYTVDLDLVLNGHTIQTFFGISLTECWSECSNRPSCSSINFHSSAHVCFLKNANNDNSKLEHQPGFVYRQKLTMEPVFCGSNACQDGETCNTMTNVCEIRECPPLVETQNVTVLGNVWSVDSKAILKCQTGYVPSDGNAFTVTTVCGKNGTWSKQHTCVLTTCLHFDVVNKTVQITNVALGKPVTLSSTYGERSYESQMVDGVRNSNWPCSCTLETPNPYAVIDLLESFPIRYIYLLNRGDCCAERLHNLHVWVGNTASDLNLVAHYPGTIGAECTIELPQTTDGRYVKLQIMAANAFLTLCEVEIYI